MNLSNPPVLPRILATAARSSHEEGNGDEEDESPASKINESAAALENITSLKAPAILDRRRHSFADVEQKYGFTSVIDGRPIEGRLPPMKSSGELTNGMLTTMANSSILATPIQSTYLRRGSTSTENKHKALSNSALELTKTELGIRSISLVFMDPEMENQYQMYFIKRSLFSLRRNVVLILLLFTAMYISFFVYNKSAAESWSKSYSSEVKGKITLINIDQFCPVGWYCLSCDVTKNCGEYSIRNDFILWGFGALLPSLIVLILLVRLNESILAKRIHFISAAYCTWITSIGILARFSLVNITTPEWNRGLLALISVSGTLMLMRVRFVDSVWSSIIITLVSIIVYSENLIQNNSNRLAASLSATLSFPATIAAISSFICLACHDNELAVKKQFLASQTLQIDNIKLINQLKSLHQKFDSRAAELDSPLEKSLMLIMSMQSDPLCTNSQLITLAEIQRHLTSSNLMTPDIESHAQEALDSDQQAWLFTEIMPKSRRKSVVRKPDLSFRIEESNSELPLSSSDYGHVPLAKKLQMRRPSKAPTWAALQHASATSSIPKLQDGAASGAMLPSTNNINQRQNVSQNDEDIPVIEICVPANGPSKNIDQDSARKRSKDSSESAGAECVIAIEPVFGNPTSDTILTIIKAPEILELLESTVNYNWDVFELAKITNNRPLSTLGCYLFDKLGLFKNFNIPIEKFWTFVTTIENGYHSYLPYHNATHAADVLHCMYFLSQTSSIANVATSHDMLSLFLAAIIHDHDHPGVNNNFLMNTNDPRAILYNDKSILENHHLASSFSVLSKQECNFISELPQADYKSIREAVIDMVLATDLSQHFILITQFKAKTSQEFNPAIVHDDKLLLFKILMKISDVSNPTKEWNIYHRWCELVLEEFMRQGDKEKALGLPISPYMDRETLNIPSSQIGFIDYVIIPLFEAYEKFDSIPCAMTTLISNKERWLDIRAAAMPDATPPKMHSPQTRRKSIVTKRVINSKQNSVLEHSSSFTRRRSFMVFHSSKQGSITSIPESQPTNTVSFKKLDHDEETDDTGSKMGNRILSNID